MTTNNTKQNAWTILCDFDGTISHADVTDTLLETFGKPGWQVLEEQWEAGEIGSQACMSKQIALLDASKEELDECLAQITIDPYFADFIAFTKEHHIPLHVVSDGLDYAINKILIANNITSASIFSNHLQQIGGREWRLSFPWHNDHCIQASGTCKCQIAKKIANNKFLMIGDGRSDFCVSGIAHHVFAKASLVDECERLHASYDKMKDFSVAPELLDKLLNEHDQFIKITEVADYHNAYSKA